jgi:hypothetical protein
LKKSSTKPKKNIKEKTFCQAPLDILARLSRISIPAAARCVICGGFVADLIEAGSSFSGFFCLIHIGCMCVSHLIF